MWPGTIYCISGAHASGKTTIFHGVLGTLRSRRISVVGTTETAREAHYLIAGSRSAPLHLEIAALQLIADIRALRSSSLVLADRSLIDNLAYLRIREQPAGASLIHDIVELVTREYCKVYRHTFITQGSYESDPSDLIRNAEVTSARQVHEEVLAIVHEYGIPYSLLERGNEVDEICQHIAGDANRHER